MDTNLEQFLIEFKKSCKEEQKNWESHFDYFAKHGNYMGAAKSQHILEGMGYVLDIIRHTLASSQKTCMLQNFYED